MANERTLPGLGLTAYADKGTDDWHNWVDPDTRLISMYLAGFVKSLDTVLPGTPTLGDIYIVKAGEANEKEIAIWDGAVGSEAWVYIVPRKGHSFYVEDESLNYQWDGTDWAEFAAGGGGGGAGGGALIGMQVFDTAGASTYTPTAGAVKARVIVTGGGGGGGGVDHPASNGAITGTGGQGGSTAISLVDVADIDGLTITVGAGGTAGPASQTVAGAGGESSVGTVVTAAGGGGGEGSETNTAVIDQSAQTMVGDIKLQGGDAGGAEPAQSYSSADFQKPNRMGGAGGNSYWGGAKRGQLTFSGQSKAGLAGVSPGQGAAGACSTYNTSGAIGGVGAPGIVVIEEYGIPEYTITTDTTTAKTLALGDAQTLVEMNNASANVLSIPLDATVAFPIGTVISVTMLGAGTTSITALTDVTLNGVSAGSGDIDAQYSGVSLYKRGTDEWVVQGAIGAVA